MKRLVGLFLAGVMPGVLIGLGLMVVAYRQALREGPEFDPPLPPKFID
mgnify:CR=1 FL=1